MVSVAFKQNLKKKYGIKFNNEKLLEDAFTHSSYANEHPGRKDYEKLEFLGDAVLELAVSDYLYRHFPRLNEGELTRMRSNIVRTEGFSEFAIECGFPEEINLGKGEEKAGARKRKTLLEDVFEAFNGALFLDQGMPAVQHFLHLTVYPLIAEGDFNASRDYKTELQERLQVNGPVKIEYQVISEDESKPSFKVQLLVNGEKVSEGQGRNKKAAEQQAAQAALDKNK
ncbi:ribonuclease III [Lactobacillus johnsonii]|jgi:ribonuclease-3|uniref:Ribonuclease 3 n=5 Tax=Lactobacillus johnsonii TaxID=33959 RepID=RNC_LACJO|nr:ribonuclease III [Lactobacillus johnsonii]Q74IP8.1 RecName: Full=Ribonuclease 3; AltName: Full=Ribonuclease III; Short=RNase III [Lactobacillus johnsonii NCC 533]AAS09289.1 ribonuclease III [Lactobacillus johnsonii NCC 533]AEB93030.1 ribonuclease III [Lactobacillus johnsonii DPC 6026]AHA97165.1 ribonuclease III [Lactobacillus johnsonii N6.2]AOG27083.1 ribonuclease III [Lactobacillus johnsonii]AYN49072.1 Ribonuclease 3 [Lactobacillus johnsonii]